MKEKRGTLAKSRHFRLTPAHDRAVEKLARSAGVTFSDALRLCIKEAALRRGLWEGVSDVQ